MSWLKKLLPPKIKRDTPSGRKAIPEGLWSKCPACEAVLYRSDLESNLNVCPKCGHHQRIRARHRVVAGGCHRGPGLRGDVGDRLQHVDARVRAGGEGGTQKLPG